MEQPKIYQMKLHESIIEQVTGEGCPTKWQITRVAGGWLYQDINPNRTTVSEFFVPYNNEFQVTNIGHGTIETQYD